MDPNQFNKKTSQMKKTILITGCSSGFGKLAAEHLAKQGHTVFATLRNTQGKNKEVAEEIKAYGQANNLKLFVVDLDVTNETSIQNAMNEVATKTSTIDVLINNAGYGNIGLQEAFTISSAQQMFDVNVFGILRMNKAVLPIMRKQKSGLIINLSSGVGRLVFPFGGIYAASKHAVEALTESLRLELAPFGIDSVCVEPGGYGTTGFNTAIQFPDDKNVLESYGSYAEAPYKMMQAFASSLTEQPDPMEIVSIMEELINAPFGSRKVRYPKANVAEMLHPLNKVSEEIQGQLGFDKLVFNFYQS